MLPLFGASVTGSRYFGTARPESDFDYAIEASIPKTIALLFLGFRVRNSRCLDENTIVVLEHVKARIHVQVVKDLRAKLEIQEAMRLHGLGELLRNKEVAHKLWQSHYAARRERE